jgi:O-antigen ligase
VRRALPLPRLDPLSYPLWFTGVALIGVVMAWALPARPFLVAGALGGTILLLALLLRPLLLLGLVLAVGVVNLGFVTGGERQLFPGLGGLDMNGIRLVGLVAGLTMLLLIDRRMLNRALAPEGRWYVLFLAFAAGTLFVSPSPMEGLRLLFKLAYPFLLFVAVWALADGEDDLETLGRWTLGAATVLVFVVNPLMVMAGGYTIDDTGHMRLQGLGMHQNPFSMYLLAMSVLALARYLFRGQLRYLILALALGAWIVPTLTRISLAASLTAFGALAVYAAVLRRNLKPVLVAGLVALVVAIPLTPVALERTLGFVPGPVEFLALLRDPAGLLARMSWSGREQIWPVLLAAFHSSPFIGLGMGSSGSVLRSGFPSGVSDVPHNEYLRILVDTGLIGLALMAAGILVWWLAAARAGVRTSGVGREYAGAAVALIPAAAVLAFTDNAIDYYAQFTQFIGFFCAAALVTVRRAGADVLEEEDTG